MRSNLVRSSSRNDSNGSNGSSSSSSSRSISSNNRSNSRTTSHATISKRRRDAPSTNLPLGDSGSTLSIQCADCGKGFQRQNALDYHRRHANKAGTCLASARKGAAAGETRPSTSPDSLDFIIYEGAAPEVFTSFVEMDNAGDVSKDEALGSELELVNMWDYVPSEGDSDEPGWEEISKPAVRRKPRRTAAPAAKKAKVPMSRTSEGGTGGIVQQQQQQQRRRHGGSIDPSMLMEEAARGTGADGGRTRNATTAKFMAHGLVKGSFADPLNRTVPAALVPELAKFLVGAKSATIGAISSMFRETHSGISKRHLQLKIEEISVRVKPSYADLLLDATLKPCWAIKSSYAHLLDGGSMTHRLDGAADIDMPRPSSNGSSATPLGPDEASSSSSSSSSSASSSSSSASDGAHSYVYSSSKVDPADAAACRALASCGGCATEGDVVAACAALANVSPSITVVRQAHATSSSSAPSSSSASSSAAFVAALQAAPVSAPPTTCTTASSGNSPTGSPQPGAMTGATKRPLPVEAPRPVAARRMTRRTSRNTATSDSGGNEQGRTAFSSPRSSMRSAMRSTMRSTAAAAVTTAALLEGERVSYLLGHSGSGGRASLYGGTVAEWDASTGKHRIRFDDGEEGWYSDLTRNVKATLGDSRAREARLQRRSPTSVMHGGSESSEDDGSDEGDDGGEGKGGGGGGGQKRQSPSSLVHQGSRRSNGDGRGNGLGRFVFGADGARKEKDDVGGDRDEEEGGYGSAHGPNASKRFCCISL